MAQILSAIGKIHDRLTDMDERVKRIERAILDAIEPASKDEVKQLRESFIETRAAVEETTDVILKKPPVAEPDPRVFNHTLEDF